MPFTAEAHAILRARHSMTPGREFDKTNFIISAISVPFHF
jgi:hypothetical protein